MKISVVVSTYSKKRLHYLLKCVESLRSQSTKPDEILLVLDPLPQLIEFYRSKLPEIVKIVASRKRGLSNARNAGVQSSKGDIIAFIDDDAFAEKDWLKYLLDGYKDSDVAGVGGCSKPLWQNDCPIWFPEELNWVVGCSYKGLPEHKAAVRNPIGCNMSFRRRVFEQVGKFRSDVGRFGKVLFSGEEAELSARILKKILNSKILYEPRAMVYHVVEKERGRFVYLLKRSFYEGLSKAMIAEGGTDAVASLSTENQYLKYLVSTAIPSRLKKIHKYGSFCQLLALLLSTGSVLAGFSLGRLKQAKF